MKIGNNYVIIAAILIYIMKNDKSLLFLSSNLFVICFFKINFFYESTNICNSIKSTFECSILTLYI